MSTTKIELPATLGIAPTMELRDWFAGQALQGMLANPAHDDADYSARFYAECAYQCAEKMLKERDGHSTS